MGRNQDLDVAQTLPASAVQTSSAETAGSTPLMRAGQISDIGLRPPAFPYALNRFASFPSVL